MHVVQMLDQALELARQAGYQLRQDALDGATSGACTLKGRKWLILDPAVAPLERLEIVIQALETDPAVASHSAPPELARLLGLRRRAA